MLKIYIALLILLQIGCISQIASLEDAAQGWVGRPLKDLKELVERPESYASRTGWKEQTYRLDNGNLVYVEPDHKDCFIHFEVNSNGIIVGYRTVGKNCD